MSTGPVGAGSGGSSTEAPAAGRAPAGGQAAPGAVWNSRTRVSGMTGEEPPCLPGLCDTSPVSCRMPVQPGSPQEPQDRLNWALFTQLKVATLGLMEWGLKLLEVSMARWCDPAPEASGQVQQTPATVTSWYPRGLLHSPRSQPGHVEAMAGGCALEPVVPGSAFRSRQTGRRPTAQGSQAFPRPRGEQRRWAASLASWQARPHTWALPPAAALERGRPACASPRLALTLRHSRPREAS